MPEQTLKPGWKRVKFGDVVHLNTERVADPKTTGIKRYVGLEHITPNDLHIRNWGLVAEGTTFTNYFKPGQVLFGKRRAYQRKVSVADFEGVCSSDIYVFESKNSSVLLPKLLPFICRTEGFYEYAVGTSAGSLSPRTNWSHLTRYEFALPPFEEQVIIAKMLWDVQYYSDSLQESIFSFFALQKSIQENLLLDHSSETDNTKLRLDEIFEINPIEPPLPQDVPYIPMDAIDEWIREITRYTIRGNRGGIRARAGDILLARITPSLENGKTVIVPKIIQRCGGSTELIVLRGKGNMTPDLVYWIATSPSVRQYAISTMHGTTGRQRVAADDFGRIRINLIHTSNLKNVIDILNTLYQVRQKMVSLRERSLDLKAMKCAPKFGQYRN